MKKLFFAILLAAASCCAQAQSAYSARQVRIIVPYAPGGISDVMTRILAQNPSEAWGQPVLVDGSLPCAIQGRDMQESTRTQASEPESPAIERNENVDGDMMAV